MSDWDWLRHYLLNNKPIPLPSVEWQDDLWDSGEDDE